jgi:mono/diheme cytochrome c family protein
MGVALLVIAPAGSGAQDQPAARPGGWTIPPGAAEEKSPAAATPQTLVAARALFQKNCQRCHGPKGVGDGPDADPDYMDDMDLTNPKRAGRNPDGVVFHKIWNGRKSPKMPAFKEELSREQVWALVAYVQTLRKGAEPK